MEGGVKRGGAILVMLAYVSHQIRVCMKGCVGPGVEGGYSGVRYVPTARTPVHRTVLCTGRFIQPSPVGVHSLLRTEAGICSALVCFCHTSLVCWLLHEGGIPHWLTTTHNPTLV
jgi:hypothetical protein